LGSNAVSGRVGGARPEDIARAALLLASETTVRQVTGQLISVGGGWRMP